MVDPLGRGHSHPEGDAPRDLPHDGLDAAESLDVGPGQVGPGRLVPASDVIPDARRRDIALVGDAASDRLAVARVMVGAEHAVVGVARVHAPLELREAALVDRPEGLDGAHGPPFA
jgi:hypothetical protein